MTPALQTGLSDLSDDVLLLIWRNLGPLDLASLARQDRRFRRLAKCPLLWRKICEQRWPSSGMSEAYGGDHCLMYRQAEAGVARTRLGYPPGFVAAIDEVLGLAASGGVSVHLTLRLMKLVFTIGLEVSRSPSLRHTLEYKQYTATLLARLSSHPQEFVGFVDAARSSLEEFDMWQAALIGWPETPWKRSATAFLLDLISGVEPWRFASLRKALETRVKLLDEAIRSVEDEAESLAIKVPCGTPSSHWWYFLHGSSFSSLSIC